jgi:hypothetical protein
MEQADEHPYSTLQRNKAHVVHDDFVGLGSQPSGDPCGPPRSPMRW